MSAKPWTVEETPSFAHDLARLRKAYLSGRRARRERRACDDYLSRLRRLLRDDPDCIELVDEYRFKDERFPEGWSGRREEYRKARFDILRLMPVRARYWRIPVEILRSDRTVVLLACYTHVEFSPNISPQHLSARLEESSRHFP